MLTGVDRLKIGLISTLGYWIIRVVCATLRWEVHEIESRDSIWKSGKRIIFTFWHGRIFLSTYFHRHQGIVVMTSRNRDGDYIARVIERFGYGTARGSSTRGSHAATLQCLRALKGGKDLGLTIDGPQGPRYIAKPGAAFLARKSGNPVVTFNISANRKWTISSWDRFQIPKPFARVVVLFGEPIYVDENATPEEMRAAEDRIQRSLDELRDRGDSWWGGTPDR